VGDQAQGFVAGDEDVALAEVLGQAAGISRRQGN